MGVNERGFEAVALMLSSCRQYSEQIGTTHLNVTAFAYVILMETSVSRKWSKAVKCRGKRQDGRSRAELAVRHLSDPERGDLVPRSTGAGLTRAHCSG